MVEGTCHCGAVRFEVDEAPSEVTDCNCSICRRYAVRWAYYSPRHVRITPSEGATDIYLCGDRMIEFHRCRNCGCITHWAPADHEYDRMAVNARLMAPEVWAHARVRHLDGADTWTETFD